MNLLIEAAAAVYIEAKSDEKRIPSEGADKSSRTMGNNDKQQPPERGRLRHPRIVSPSHEQEHANVTRQVASCLSSSSTTTTWTTSSLKKVPTHHEDRKSCETPVSDEALFVPPDLSLNA